MTIRLPEIDATNNSFQQALEKQLSIITEAAIERWMKDSRSSFDKALAKLLEEANKLMLESLNRVLADAAQTGFSSSGSESMARSDNVSLDQAYLSLGQSLANLTAAYVSEQFFGDGTATRQSVAETDRSRTARSLSQKQAQQIQAVRKGNRNL